MSIFTKLFVSILLVCLIMLGSMTWLINANFRNGLQDYLNNTEAKKGALIAENVKSFYSEKFGWRRLTSSPYLWAGLFSQLGEPPPPQGRVSGPSHGLPPEPFNRPQAKATTLVPLSVRANLLDDEKRSLLGAEENLQFDARRFRQLLIPVVVNDKTVGWLSIIQSRSISGDLAEGFFYEQSKYTFTVLAITILFSFAIAFYLVRHFLHPLKALHKGAVEVEQGNLDYQITEKGRDELSALIVTFNQLVQALKKQKSDRDQWLSDISHELRTPIAVLQSEIEAIQDGIRKPEPRHISSLHSQVMTLRKLVNDLYELSVTDSGVNFEFTEISDVALLAEEVFTRNELRLSQQHLECELDIDKGAPYPVYGDPKALSQLFLNLLENSIRYTDSPGSVRLAVTGDSEQIYLTFEDSAPGVPDDSLPRLFDRLYRVDKSRSRSSGGSGLGLAICKNITEAHGGRIEAYPSLLGGLKTEITLQRYNRKDA